MRLDTSTLYPNLYAETTRHTTATASTSPRSSSAKPSSSPRSRKANHTASPSTSSHLRATLTTSPTRASNNTPTPTGSPSKTALRPLRRAASTTNVGSSMPPLRATRSRPGTPEPSAALPSVMLRSREQVVRTPTRSTRSRKLDHVEPEQSDASGHKPPVTLGARAVAVHGDLAIGTSVARSSPTMLSPSPCVITVQASSHALPLQEIVTTTARPRSRYARREGVTTPIKPLHPTDPSSSGTRHSTPQLRGSHSTGSLLGQQRSNSSTKPLEKPRPLLSWTEQDTSSFFLTELDAKQAADQWKIAKAIASGSHCLYAFGQFEKAVAYFADALAVAQQIQSTQQDDDTLQQALALVALLHHHMGIAFKEDRHDKWALMMQKKTLELAQECDDLRLQARALKAIGVLFLDRQDYDKALDCQKQALQLAKQTNDAELEARVYANLGNLSAVQCEWDHAIVCHERDLAMSSSPQVDSAVGQARAHRNLSLTYAKLSDTSASKEMRLDHELEAARINATNAFESDIRRHSDDCVGNIYLQLTSPDHRLAEMVASSLKDRWTARYELKGEHESVAPIDPLHKHVS